MSTSRVERRGGPGATGQGDLAEAELLHPRRALPGQLHQPVPRIVRLARVGPSPLGSTLRSRTSASRRARTASDEAASRPAASRSVQVVVHDQQR